MQELRLESFAKINWMLRILRKREDGFHELETIFQSISLHDVITIRPSVSLSMTCSDRTIPSDESNLAMRAARAMMDRFGAPACAIELDKRIPAGGGLGGGSSNAAAVLRALVPHCRLIPTSEELAEVALGLGSDVPFFLIEGTAYATGRGERLVPLAPQSDVPLVLLLPEEKVMTPHAYRMIRRARDERTLPEGAAVGLARCQALARRGLLEEPDVLVNDLESVVFEALPRLAALRDELASLGALWCRMSGSGSTIVGAFATDAARDRALDAMAGRVKAVRGSSR